MFEPTPEELAERPVKVVPAPRLVGLDALRGLAVLLMCLSGLLPTALPNWMYHGYYPAYLPVGWEQEQAEETPSPVAAQNEGGENNEAEPDALGLADVDDLLAPDPGVTEEAGVVEWEPAPKKFRGKEWPSFTWVDWVFPMFLFAMGAAIPLALSRRLARGDPTWRLMLGAVGRFVLLVFFAVYIQQITPWHQNPSPGLAEWWTTLLGLGLLVPVLARLPFNTPRGLRLAVRGFGVAGVMLLLAMVNDRDTNAPFAWRMGEDVDIIILLLAWASLPAAWLWLWTRNAGWVMWTVRLVVALPLAFVAHQHAMPTQWRWFANTFDGFVSAMQWPKQLLDLRGLNQALPGHLPESLLNLSTMYDFTWFKLLWVVVPGTVVGDILVRYMAEQRELANIPRPAPVEQSKAVKLAGTAWGIGRHAIITVGLLGCVVAILVGLKDYAGAFARLGPLPVATPYAALLLGLPPLVIALLAMIGKPGPNGRTLRRLTLWGTAWLTMGLILCVWPDPRTPTGFVENGISKGPPARLSWYLVSLGLSILFLVVLMLWTDVRGWRWPFGLLTTNGRNPMLAYALIHGPLAAVVAIPWLMPFVADGVPASLDALLAWMIERRHGLTASPWHDAGWDLVKTLGVAVVVWIATKRGVVLRS